ncbi:MBL fold metallo-hydrolase [Lachnospiraceae bacterium LCP25S3_G4]
MKVEKFVIGILSTNCYLAYNEDTREAVIIDPAIAPEYFIKHIESEKLQVQAILLTHGHFDHIGGIDQLLKEFQVPVYVMDAEQELIQDERLNMSICYTDGYTFDGATYIKDGEVLSLIGEEIKVLATPGHTIGSCCYYIENENLLFSGDTLFFRSVGRSDLATGNEETLRTSIKTKLNNLPDETIVYPGHASETKIGYEKTNNPYF